MNFHTSAGFALLALAGAVSCGCAHTPPGTPVEIALAKRAELYRLPATPAPLITPAARTAVVQASAPAPPEKTELVADAYSRGEFCAKAGKDEEAIAAFKEAVKIDPTFVDAWTYLAALYEKKGNEKEAMNAFKRAKGAGNKAG